MPGSIFITYARDGSCHAYCTYNGRFDHTGCCLLFCLPVRILDALNYFGLYKFTDRIRTNVALVAVAFHGCSEVN